MGSVTDIDPTQLYDDSKSLAEGAITIPGYNADGWSVRLFSALSDSWPSANEKGLVPALYAKPSSGLEPETPSLPSRFRGNGSQPMATDLA
jgi:hypothetical protein